MSGLAPPAQSDRVEDDQLFPLCLETLDNISHPVIILTLCISPIPISVRVRIAEDRRYSSIAMISPILARANFSTQEFIKRYSAKYIIPGRCVLHVYPVWPLPRRRTGTSGPFQHTQFAPVHPIRAWRCTLSCKRVSDPVVSHGNATVPMQILAQRYQTSLVFSC